MPLLSKDSRFVLCAYCNEKFMFGYEASKHEKEKHADQLQSSNL